MWFHYLRHVGDRFWSESSSRRCIEAHTIIRSQSPAWQWKWNRLLIMLSAGLAWEVPAWLDIIYICHHSQGFTETFYRKRIVTTGPQDWAYDHGRHSSVFRLFSSSFSACFIMDMLKRRKQPKRLIRGKSSHYRLYCLGSANKFRPAWGHTVTEGHDTIYRLDETYYTCGHKSKDISPSIAWRRETWEEEARDDLSWKYKSSSSNNCSLQLFQRQRWGSVWETRCSVHMGFSERTDTVLKWTELA